MENQNLHSNEDTFLAQWLEGNLTDTELKKDGTLKQLARTVYSSFFYIQYLQECTGTSNSIMGRFLLYHNKESRNKER